MPFGVPLKETFLSENLKDAGYSTALFGKVNS
jgi:arylsulfatase A-like enzyme